MEHDVVYFGIEYHLYYPTLYERNLTGASPNKPLVVFGNKPVKNSVHLASSIYLSG